MNDDKSGKESISRSRPLRLSFLDPQWQKVLSSPGDLAPLIEALTRRNGRPWAEALLRRVFFGERRLCVENLHPNRVLSEAKDAFKAAQKAERDSAE